MNRRFHFKHLKKKRGVVVHVFQNGFLHGEMLLQDVDTENIEG